MLPACKMWNFGHRAFQRCSRYALPDGVVKQPEIGFNQQMLHSYEPVPCMQTPFYLPAWSKQQHICSQALADPRVVQEQQQHSTVPVRCGICNSMHNAQYEMRFGTGLMTTLRASSCLLIPGVYNVK